MKDYFKKLMDVKQPFWADDGYGTRFHEFQNLMRYRIRDVLIVSSLYDLYVFEEDGQLYDLIRSEYRGLNLSHTPELTRVSSGRQAIEMLKQEKRFDLIITTLHIEDMGPETFARKIRRAGIDVPLVLLAFDNRELAELLAHGEQKLFDQVFIWLGNYRLIMAIIKYFEDRFNVEHDTHIMGVQSIILIEDNIRYYSYYLPILYSEVMQQSQRCIQEGINVSHKNLRQRARPKVLLCTFYEEAEDYFENLHETVLGIISDIEFPRHGKRDMRAGFRFAKEVVKKHADIPILLQSSEPKNESETMEMGCHFFVKNSPRLDKKLRRFMVDHLSFGDFVFLTPENKEIGRASNLISFEKMIKAIPVESFKYHADRNHFSNWLKARTEFWLAHQIRPIKASDFPSVEDTRTHLLSTLREYRKIRQRGIISDFDKEMFDPNSSISRIGGGSLGGKARGLSFFNTLINNYQIQHQVEDVRISVPPALIIATDVFDQYLELNELRDFALIADYDDKEILDRFLKADKFPEETVTRLREFLELVQKPIAVRSSGLLEDSHVHPFAGVYETIMLPNCDPDPKIRLKELLRAIRQVYASTFYQSAKEYMKATSFHQEEEKMAVIIQVISGSARGNRYYPVFSGTAQSYNFYPSPPQKASDGIASIALGLGKMVVEGGATVRFCPKYPHHIIQLSSPKMAMQSSQHEFFALELCGKGTLKEGVGDHFVEEHPLKSAEEDGVLHYVASTYSPENEAIYDGVSRPGVRLVSFAPILKFEVFPLARILELLLDMGSWSMGTPVDIEFAVELDVPRGERKNFNVLQVRPMVLTREVETVNIEKTDAKKLICSSNRVLGNGIIDDVYDILLVDPNRFDRSKSKEVAAEVAKYNLQMLSEKRPYMLIGLGRWGSRDPWLGIPVKWDQISGARIIIEAGFKDMVVEPSQGSHFIENLNSFAVGYFTVPSSENKNFVDWEWLSSFPPISSGKYINHLRFEKRLLTKMNGRESLGIIYKP